MPTGNSPSWETAYSIFGWPNGITVWALFLTLVVVAKQTHETARAAKAARRQVAISNRALILQFRPKVCIRFIKILETDDSLSIKVIVVNKGGTPAYIKNGDVSFDWIWTYSKESHIVTAHFKAATIAPGAEHVLDIPFSEDWVMYNFSVDEAEENPKHPQMQLRCQGTTAYTDDVGINRQVGFSRKRLEKSQTWVIDSDPEYEYHY